MHTNWVHVVPVLVSAEKPGVETGTEGEGKPSGCKLLEANHNLLWQQGLEQSPRGQGQEAGH